MARNCQGNGKGLARDWMEATIMRDPTSLPLLTPELLLGSGPLPAPPPGPVRFVLDGWPEREQPPLVRDCFARLGYRYDIEPIRELPFRVDISLSMQTATASRRRTVESSRAAASP